MTRLLRFSILAVLLGTTGTARTDDALPPLEGRVLFLGDSITHDGRYISFIESWLRERRADQPVPELINLGLPSETLSGRPTGNVKVSAGLCSSG